MIMRRGLAAVAALLMLTLAACTSGAGSGSGHGSRDHLYESIDELAAESIAVAIVTVEGHTEFPETTVGDEARGAYSAFDATVVEVASPPKLGEAVGDELKASVTSPVPGDRVLIRMLGTAERPGPTDFLEDGESYLLFLTGTGLPESPANEFYIAGGSAGVYRSDGESLSSESRFTKDGVEREGDELPQTVTLSELRGS
jgi:hypothetical protein